jgi:hypothetical protein
MEIAEDILDRARWFYISNRPYNSFHILIVENSTDDWTLYFLDKQAESGDQLREVSGMMAGIDTFLDVKLEKKPKPIAPKPKSSFLRQAIPDDYSDTYVYDVFRLIENSRSNREDVDRNISGCVVIRKIHGNLGAMIHEFLKIVK